MLTFDEIIAEGEKIILIDERYFRSSSGVSDDLDWDTGVDGHCAIADVQRSEEQAHVRTKIYRGQGRQVVLWWMWFYGGKDERDRGRHGMLK